MWETIGIIAVSVATFIAGILAAEGIRYGLGLHIPEYYLKKYPYEYNMLPEWVQQKIYSQYGILERRWNELLKEKQAYERRKREEWATQLVRERGDEM